MVKLSIILPCYNEAGNLQKLIAGYRTALKDLDNVELVLVDNGSEDNTADIIDAELSGKNKFRLTVVSLPLNKGYGYGILRGISASGGEYIAWSHADMQCSPADVVHLYESIMQQPEPARCFGKGFRVNKTGKSGILTRTQTMLARIILGYNLTEINAQPKLFHKNFIREFRKPPKEYELDLYAFYKAMRLRMDIVTIPVYFHERKAGRSKWAYSFCSRFRFIIHNLLYLFKLRLMKNNI